MIKEMIRKIFSREKGGVLEQQKVYLNSACCAICERMINEYAPTPLRTGEILVHKKCWDGK
jgi:hypothetical protein